MANELLVKIQHQDFEPGEFVHNKKEDFESALSIIRSFPWEEERKRLQVSLTNPSITFETNDHLFLKLSLYYHDKFVLYFFDGRHLYTHSFIGVEDSFSFIEYFFNQQDVDRTQYKLETTWLQDLKIHF